MVVKSYILYALSVCWFCLRCCLSLIFFLSFFFLVQSFFRAQKSMKNNEMVLRRMAFWCFLRRTYCSLASYSILFFLFFQSVPMLLTAISTGTNFSSLVPRCDIFCIEMCTFLFMSFFRSIKLSELFERIDDAHYAMW